MKNNQEVRIELTVTSAKDLMTLGTKSMVDLEHPPYREFIVDFPSEKIDEKEFERMIGSLSNKDAKLANLSRKDKLELIEDYNNNSVEIHTKIDNNSVVVGTKEWYLKLYTSSPVFSLEKEVEGIYTDIDFVTKNENIQRDFDNLEEFRKGLMHYMFGVLGLVHFMQSDKMRVEPSTRLMLDDSKKKKKSKSKNKKTYIYKKKYMINSSDVDVVRESKRDYERRVDQWVRRAHWKTTRSGNKVWIEEKVCKARTSVDSGKVSQEYKITKIK